MALLTISNKTMEQLKELRALTLESYRKDGFSDAEIEKMSLSFTDEALISMGIDALVTIFRKHDIGGFTLWN